MVPGNKIDIEKGLTGDDDLLSLVHTQPTAESSLLSPSPLQRFSVVGSGVTRAATTVQDIVFFKLGVIFNHEPSQAQAAPSR